MRPKYIWMNGEILPFEEATVHFLTPTLHYGTGVFDGIRCYETSKGSAVFRLREHLRRFIDSINILGITQYPYDHSDLYRAVHQTIRANGFSECYVRPLVFMAGPLTLELDDWTPVTGIAAWQWGPYLGEGSHERGIRLMVSSFTRHHPNVMMTKTKVVGNYVNSTLAKTLARRAGFDEAAMLDPQGYVVQCSGENLFVVRDGVLYTPPRMAVLEGVTRDSVIRLALDLELEVVEQSLTRDQLYAAEEIFVCGTAAEIVPVREVDYRPVSSGERGPITAELQAAFYDTVSGKGRRSHEWLDYVDETVMAA